MGPPGTLPTFAVNEIQKHWVPGLSLYNLKEQVAVVDRFLPRDKCYLYCSFDTRNAATRLLVIIFIKQASSTENQPIHKGPRPFLPRVML